MPVKPNILAIAVPTNTVAMKGNKKIKITIANKPRTPNPTNQSNIANHLSLIF